MSAACCVGCCHRRCTSCLACWRCCYFVLLLPTTTTTLLLLLAVRLLSCARRPLLHTYIHPYCACIIIILALPVWRPRWGAGSPSAMALFIIIDACLPADCRAHGEGARSLAGTMLISMLQQSLPHHRRIICTRKYARACTHTTANLVQSCLCPSAASRRTMTTRRSPAAATLGQGA